MLELIGSESELVNPCVGSLRGTAWGSRSFFHLLNPHWFLHPEVVRTQHWNPGLEGAGVGPRLLTPEMCLLNFYPPHVGLGTSPIHACAPHSGLDGCGFFNSIVVRLPFNFISDSSEQWWFYILVVILMRLCEEIGHVCLHCHLDQKSSYLYCRVSHNILVCEESKEHSSLEIISK